jgi:thiamine biosynthesis lipoprotein
VDIETSVSYLTWKTELVLGVRARPTRRLQRWLEELLHDEVDRLDLLASRFRSDSVSTRVSRNAGSWTEVPWDFVAVLTAALTAAEATDGLVHPLLGRQVVAAGYDEWAGQDSGIVAGTGPSAWQAIEISAGAAEARVRIPPESALDLGGVAKGWLADRLAQTTHTSTGFDVVANMGGDLRVIAPEAAWIVSADPDLPGIAPVAFALEDAGLATSGVGHRAWKGGHHLIDPLTGHPADSPWFSVSVLAADAAGANAAATAGFVAGQAGPTLVQTMGLDAWFVGESEQVVGRWRSETALADA